MQRSHDNGSCCLASTVPVIFLVSGIGCVAGSKPLSAVAGCLTSPATQHTHHAGPDSRQLAADL